MTELPAGWLNTTLGEVADTQLGKMLSAKARSGNGGRPYLRNKNVQWGQIDLDDLLLMTFTDSEFEKFRLREGDLLVCEGGEVGRAAIWRGGIECAYQKALHRVRPRGGVAPEYLLFLLMHYASTRAFARYVTGSTIAHLPQEDLRRLPVPLPPLAEQRRIVGALEQQLSRIEAAADALAVAQRRISRLHAAIFSRAFSEGDEVEIAEVASLIRGVTYKKAEASSVPRGDYIPLLRATNINGNLRLHDNLVYVPHARVSDAQMLRPGDLLIATSSGSPAVIGKSALLDAEWRGTFGAFCAVLRPKASVDPRYIAGFCSSPLVRRRWSDLARGTNINNLRANHILGTKIRVPSSEAQKRVVELLERRLSLASGLFQVTIATTRRSEVLRRVLLARAFHGELVTQDPNDEPASVVLERIADERAVAPKPTRRRKKKARL